MRLVSSYILLLVTVQCSTLFPQPITTYLQGHSPSRYDFQPNPLHTALNQKEVATFLRFGMNHNQSSSTNGSILPNGPFLTNVNESSLTNGYLPGNPSSLANGFSQENSSSLVNGSPLMDGPPVTHGALLPRGPFLPNDSPAMGSLIPMFNRQGHFVEYFDSSFFDEPNMDEEAASKGLKLKQATESITGTSKQRISFLELPPELRQMIYGYAMNFDQTVQRPYPPTGFAPAQMCYTHNPGFHLNHGFNILRANIQVYWDAMSWFRKQCTAVYIPMNVASVIASSWALIQQKKHSELTSEICTSLTALAYMNNVHLSFYMGGLKAWEVGYLREDQLRALALRLQEVANMLDTVQFESQPRRRVTVHFGVSEWIEDEQREAFLDVISAADSAARQGRAHTDWRVVPRLYGSASAHDRDIIKGLDNDVQFATNIKLSFKALPDHIATNLCKDDPEYQFYLKDGLRY